MLENFKEYLLLNDYTNQIYYYRIKNFLEKVKIENISENTINQYILKQKEKVSAETVNLDLKALKVYLKFLKKDITIPKLFKTIKKLPDTIPLYYFEKKIIPVAECIFENPLKIKTILYFLYYTGIRKSEIVTLKRKDIDLKDRTAKIYVKKTKEERLIVFSKRVAKLLENYFSTEAEKENAFNLQNNSISYIFDTLKSHFEDIKLRPHLFRHSFATNLLINGADVTIVAKLLGHKNIQSTLRYLGNNGKIIKDIYDKYMK